MGFTRARDHLVLAIRVKTTKKGSTAQTAWLDSLADATGAPVLVLPIDADDGSTAPLRIRGTSGATTEVAARVWHTGPKDPERPPQRAAPRWLSRGAPPIARQARPPYRIVPSAAELGWPEIEGTLARAALGLAERLPTTIRWDAKGIDSEALGSAVHAFLAADIEGLFDEERIERAGRLLEGVGMTGHVRAESLVRAGDTLRAWVHARWPGCTWRREVPIDALVASSHGERRVTGVIDLLLETGEGCVIVDHKTFPGTTEAAWRARCRDFVGQLATYAVILGQVEGKRVAACWLHLPVGGAMVEVRIDGDRS